ncbi:MAG: LCP family protein [Clostridia bacterium]|nr:LCP family protein [Clostridia bacterium]
MKRSVRDFLLSLFLAVFVFAAAAFFLIDAAEVLMGDVMNKIGSVQTEENETGENQSGDPSDPSAGGVGQNRPHTADTVNLLLVGEDRYGNADAIFLLGINSARRCSTVMLIPTNSLVVDQNRNYRLADLYPTRGISFLKEFVLKETGVSVDYYATMSMDALSNTIDFLGGIQYDVPENMYYFDPTQNLKINLKKGVQILTGDQAVQLVSYRGYSDGSIGREETQVEFAKVFCSAFLRPENLPRAKVILYNIYYHMETDFREVYMDEFGEMMFNFPAYTQEYVKAPGALSGGGMYTVQSARAKSMMEAYQ